MFEREKSLLHTAVSLNVYRLSTLKSCLIQKTSHIVNNMRPKKTMHYYYFSFTWVWESVFENVGKMYREGVERGECSQDQSQFLEAMEASLGNLKQETKFGKLQFSPLTSAKEAICRGVETLRKEIIFRRFNWGD